MKVILTRVPNRYAYLLTIGEHGPQFVTARELSDLEDKIGAAYMELIRDGYAGFHDHMIHND